MIQKLVNYEELQRFCRHAGAEWVDMPIHDGFAWLLEEARKNGYALLEGWGFSEQQLHSLKEEEKGRIYEYRFGYGKNEGFMFFLRMDSGQVIYVKTFDPNFDVKVCEWITNNQKKAIVS